MAASCDEGERKDLDEFVTLLELHPEMTEIIVEGRADAAMVKWFLREEGIDCDVSPVDDRLNVPAEYLESHDLAIGNRNEVIAAAIYLEPFSHLLKQIACVADSDFDHLLSLDKNFSFLIMTELSCLEIAAVTPQTLAKFHAIFLRGDQRIDLTSAIEDCIDAAVEIFLVRAALSNMPDPPGMINRPESCVKKLPGFVFDGPALLRKCVAEMRLADEEIEAIISDIDELRSRVNSDKRRYVNWHDFVKLFIKRIGLRNDLARGDILERAILTSASAGYLARESPFSELVHRFKIAVGE